MSRTPSLGAITGGIEGVEAIGRAEVHRARAFVVESDASIAAMTQHVLFGYGNRSPTAQ